MNTTQPVRGKLVRSALGTLLVLGVGVLLGLCLGGGLTQGGGSGPGPAEASGIPSSGIPWDLLRTAAAAQEAGDYLFLPNRRTVWVVNRTNGRMATYQFRDDEIGSVDRSRVAQIDLNAFPREDTAILMSDRNLNNLLWLCNTRTGDVQLWQPMADGSLKADLPVSTSMDLRTRE